MCVVFQLSRIQLQIMLYFPTPKRGHVSLSVICVAPIYPFKKLSVKRLFSNIAFIFAFIFSIYELIIENKAVNVGV